MAETDGKSKTIVGGSSTPNEASKLAAKVTAYIDVMPRVHSESPGRGEACRESISTTSEDTTPAMAEVRESESRMPSAGADVVAVDAGVGAIGLDVVGMK